MSQRKAAHQGVFLLEVHAAQVAVVLLGNALGMEHIVFQFLFGASGVHHQHRHHEHSLILTLKLLQQRLGVLAVGGEVRGNDVHVIAGTDSLLLFLDLGTVKLRDGVLDGLDGSGLVNGLNVERDDLGGLHIQEVCQHPVTQVGSGDGQIGHGTVKTTHLEGAASMESEGSGSDEVLHRQAGIDQPLPVEQELIGITHVEHGVHQMESLLAVEGMGNHT